MDRCIVHDPPPADYDSRGQEDFLPPLKQLEREFNRHVSSLIGPHTHFWRRVHSKLDPYCGYCEEEFRIRRYGIEDVLIEEAAQDAHCMEQCSCPADSPNRDYWLKSLRRAYLEVA